jgi:hypothetical protein
MRIIEVTIHTMETLDGTKVEYARVVHRQGNTLLCRNLMPYRLTPEERALAKYV